MCDDSQSPADLPPPQTTSVRPTRYRTTLLRAALTLLLAAVGALGCRAATEGEPREVDHAAEANAGVEPAGSDSPPTATPGARSARTLPVPGPGPGPGPESSPARTVGGVNPPPPGTGTGAAALRWTVPPGWISEQPASPMRRAQYRVPGPDGDGECLVFYFGPGQGGDPLANAQRWAGQFTRADGAPIGDALRTREYAVGPISVLEVEATGTYDGGQTMSAAPPAPKPGYMLLGAIASGPDANWFFKLTGPEGSIRAQRAAFETMLQSLTPGG